MEKSEPGKVYFEDTHLIHLEALETGYDYSFEEGEYWQRFIFTKAIQSIRCVEKGGSGSFPY